MADKIISASLKLDTGGATQEMQDFSKATDQAGKQLDQTNAEAKETTGVFGNLKNGLSSIPGPMQQVNQGITTVNTSLKALAANPIVLVITLLVAALVAVYKAFASTEAGAEKLEQIFSGLGAIVTVIRDRILALAGAVISFFKGDFKEAIEQTKAAVTGVGDAIVKAYSEAADATRELQEAQDELNRDLLVSRARLNRDLAATKELISDENATWGERKKAIEDVRAAEEAQTAAELANAEKTLKALERKIALDAQDADLQDEYAKQQARVFEIQEEQAQNQRSLNKQARAIEKEEQDKANEAAQKASDQRKQQLADEKKAIEERNAALKEGAEAWMKYVNDGIKFREQQAEALKEQNEKDQAARDEYLENQTNAEWNALQKQIKNQKDAAAAEKKIDEEKARAKEAILQTTSNLLGSLANLLGKQTIAGKAFAIAQTTIDTYQSAIASYKSLAGIPVVGPALGFAAAAAAIANGLATVKQIVSVKVPGTGGDVSGGDVSNPLTTSPAAPIAPQQAGTSIDQSSINGIGNAAIGRSYVLSQDVTHDQDRNERLNRAARLGG